MKKNSLFFLFAILILNSVIASDWTDTNSGDYIIYRDYTWKEPTWIGFLYYNKNTVGSFLYTNNGNVMAKILFSGEELDGEFIITGQKIISEINNDSTYTYAVNHLMQLLPKLYKWKEEPNTESLVVKQTEKLINEEQFGGKAKIKFSSYIPLFYIDSISDNNGNVIFKLEEMGLTNDENLFFNFNPIAPLKNTHTKFNMNKKTKSKEIIINNIKINLDEQWTKDAENSFFLKDVALLTVAPIDLRTIPNIKNNEENFIIKYLCSSGKDAKVLLDKTDIIGNKDKFKIISSVYDVKTKTFKNTIKLIVKHSDLKYIIITLTVEDSVYNEHKEYFNNLF